MRATSKSKVQSPRSKVGKAQFKVQGSRFKVQSYRSPFPSSYLLSLLCFALGLMSKPMLVTVPFVLLLLDYWPLRRLNQPSNLLAASSGEAAVLRPGGCVERGDVYGATERRGRLDQPLARRAACQRSRLLRALYRQDVLAGGPFDSLPASGQLAAWQVVAGAALLLAISAVVIVLARSRPYLAVGWLWFCGMLIPVIGLVQVGIQSMADRYTYVPVHRAVHHAGVGDRRSAVPQRPWRGQRAGRRGARRCWPLAPC